jgi:hypothetical protein
MGRWQPSPTIEGGQEGGGGGGDQRSGHRLSHGHSTGSGWGRRG